MKQNPRRSSGRPVTTRSGKVLKVNRSLGERYTAMRQAKTLRKVNRLRGLPKSRAKRLAWRLQPKRLAEYWFSRDGGIMALKIAGLAIVAMFILTLAVFAYYRKDLKDITDLSGSNIGGSISYYDSTGKILLWQDYNAVKRIPVPSQDISPYLKEATVSVEDKDFYKHRGFDIKGIIRSMYVDVFHRGSTQGGSTITEQLVKLTQDFNQNRSITLKVKELILAVELERNYTKDQILTSYLNIAPYGSVDYGAQTAAQDYFHVDAKNLSLAQSAFLASIPKSPSVYSPYDKTYFDQQALMNRYDYVLDLMAAQGKITTAQADAAKKTDVVAQVQPQQSYYAGIRAPYFVLAARDELNKRFTSNSAKVGGWKVITTLDMNLQQKSEEAVQNNIPNLKRYGGDEEAMVVEDVKTGQMKALVGGVDFNDPDHGQFNYAHQAYISPGSSFKPYDYSTLIDNNTNVGAGSVLYDSKGPLPGYPCTTGATPTGNCLHDYDYKYPGPETLRYALAGSRNVPAVKAMLEATPNDTSVNRTTSINKVISTADSLMGYPDAYKCFKDGVDVNQAKASDETQCYGASAIGDGAYLHLDQHINGLASLGRLGNEIPNTYIGSIQNAAGKTFYKFTQPKGTQVVRQQSAYIVDNMLSDPSASYLTSSQKWQHYKGWDTAVKTGTTNNGFDGLMMGWNTQYAVGSWVGYHTRNRSLDAAGMELITLPLTRTVMEYALDSLHTTPVNWTAPSGIQTLPAFRSQLPYATMGPAVTTDIYPSWYKQKSVSSSSVVMDKVSGKVATSCTPAAAKSQLSGNAAPNAFSIDEFYPPGSTAGTAANTNTNATDDVHHCGDNSPSVQITASDCDTSCTISATPFDGTNADGSDRSLNQSEPNVFAATVTISVNGSTICSSSNVSSGVPVPCDYSPTFNGSGTITATVTDSELYAGSDSATVNFTQGVASSPLSFQSAHSSGGSTTVSWSGGTGTVTAKKGSSTICSAPASQGSCSGSGSTPKGTSITVTDDNGSDSGTVS